MREWRRVPVYTKCGQCGALIPAETPALFIKLPNIKRDRIRCAGCVGEPPPDLPERIVRSPMTKRMQPLSKAMPRDYTARLLGERE